MMKKIVTLTIVLCGMGMVNAQKQLPATPYVHSDYFLEMLPGARSMGQDIYVNEAEEIAAPQAAPAAKQDEEQKIGYLNPAGTMFLGMDEKGKGTFIKSPGVIGSWSDSIPCWKWINQQKGYKSVKYLTAFSNAYPSYCDGENYGIDTWGNFCDTILASGGYQDAYAKDAEGDAGYYWQQATPHQTTKFPDGTEEIYMMLSSAAKPSANSCPLAAGGLPSGNSADGLWPLTNAVSTTREGISFELIENVAGDGYVSYYFGSSMHTVDSVSIPKYDLSGDSMTYDRYKPLKLTTFYDKPMSPLYIKSVTLALGADTLENLSLSLLTLTVRSQKTNEVIATSEATAQNLTDISYKPGKLLTFNFRKESEYGEVLNEGFTINEPFQVEIKGFTDTDNFGIYAAKCIVHPTKTEMLYEAGVVAKKTYEPYIMLNGIYPTLEDFYATRGAETGQEGDTIPVNMITYNSHGYQYTAAYAKWGTTNDEFAFYSTFTPYDSIARTWNIEIDMPNYIRINADYEYNLSDDDDPVTIWMYYRLFTMHIYAVDKPVIGDVIKIGKWGKYIYFRIDAIDGQQDIRNVGISGKTEKFVQNGQVFIRKNGKIYNAFGQQIQ
ncbi:MAG: hypothetical protein IJQ32_01390 [Paludibacteraceae bacterium]|nr:hypothetical protein [Paludibacteraceae bacterium]